MDPLTICLLTYNRPEYAERTLRSTLDNVSYDGPLSVHIADDGTEDDNYIPRLKEIAGGYEFVRGVGSSNSLRGGYGANYNAAMQSVHQWSRYVLPLEDDWELRGHLDLTELARMLDQDEAFGCIRLGYIGFTQELRGQFVYHEAMHKMYLLFDPTTPEPHVFAGHPRLETVEWERAVGPWPEGRDPGDTEFMVAHRKAARRGVLWPLDLVKPSGGLFCHIGTVRSY